MTAKGKQWTERTLRLEQVQERPDFQLRAGGIDRRYLKGLKRTLEAGKALPPVTVAAIGNALWLVDGYHRKAAHAAAGLLTIQAQVARMSFAEARETAREANTRHGKNLTRADKQRLWEAFMDEGKHLGPDGAALPSRVIEAQLGPQVYSRETIRLKLKALNIEPTEEEDFKPWGGRQASEDDLSADLMEEASSSLYHFAALVPQLAEADRRSLLQSARPLLEALERGEDGEAQMEALRNPLGI